MCDTVMRIIINNEFWKKYREYVLSYAYVMLIYFTDVTRFYKCILLNNLQKKTYSGKGSRSVFDFLQSKDGSTIDPQELMPYYETIYSVVRGECVCGTQPHWHMLVRLCKHVPLVRNIYCKMSLMHVSFLPKKTMIHAQ
jgi:hypothetical protein